MRGNAGGGPIALSRRERKLVKYPLRVSYTVETAILRVAKNLDVSWNGGALMTTEQEKQEIQDMIEQWGSAWAAGDSQRLKSLFDQQYPNLVYIAEENERPIVDWAGIEAYLASVLDPESTDSIWTYDNLVADVFGDTAYAQCTALLQAGRGPRMEYVMRITFIFRKVAGRWKTIHYHESANPAIGPDGHVID